MSSVSSSAATSPSSSPKTGIIVGCALAALVVIALPLVFVIRHLRRARRVRKWKAEGILDIDAPPLQPPHNKSQAHPPHSKSQAHRHDSPAPSAFRHTHIPPSSPVTIRANAPETGNAGARLRETRQMEIDARIQSAQRKMDDLKAIRTSRSAGEMASRSPAGPSTQPARAIASLRNEMQQLRDQINHLQAQRQSDWALGLSNDPLPPAYTQR